MFRTNYYGLLLLLAFVCMGHMVLAQSKVSADVKRMIDSSRGHAIWRAMEYLERGAVIAKEQHDDVSLAVVYLRMGDINFNTQPDTSLRYFTKAYDIFDKLGDMKGKGLSLHSLGFVSEERMHKVPQAIGYIEKAIAVHIKMKDTLELANMYKYLGMLKGKVGKYAAGKEDVRKAVDLYVAKQYEPGVAVCSFDMAKIFVEEKRYDSAAHYLLQAKAYWFSKNGYGRVLNINNELLNIYTVTNNKAGKIVQQQSDSILVKNKGKTYYMDKLNHYKNSYDYFKLNKDDKAADYLSSYNVLKDSLVGRGIRVD